MLTIEYDGEELLPVFSFKEEAEMFLSLDALEERWRLRQTATEELVSVLLGPCSEIDSVALDPMPVRTSRGMLRLVSLSRERFLYRLVENVHLENAGTVPLRGLHTNTG